MGRCNSSIVSERASAFLLLDIVCLTYYGGIKYIWGEYYVVNAYRSRTYQKDALCFMLIPRDYFRDVFSFRQGVHSCRQTLVQNGHCLAGDTRLLFAACCWTSGLSCLDAAMEMSASCTTLEETASHESMGGSTPLSPAQGCFIWLYMCWDS